VGGQDEGKAIVKLKKLRATEVLEILALLAGGVLLAYHSCRGQDESAAQTPRESRTFAAGPGEAGAGGGDATARQAAVESAVRELIEGVALGRVEDSGRADAQRALASLLERWSWGTEANRSTAAAVIVQQVFDQSKLQSRSVDLGPQQRRAIQSVARELTRELLLLAMGLKPGADGLQGELPAGHERISWNQLGDFPYQEGVPLPPEVQALAGRSVGIFGFMLTLGDSERVTEFVLVESLWGCCFGAVPEVNQTILVRLDPDTPAEYSAAPMLVTGRLEVGEEREAGFVTSLYRVTGATLRPADAATPVR
jgi:hypothetical protein